METIPSPVRYDLVECYGFNDLGAHMLEVDTIRDGSSDSEFHFLVETRFFFPLKIATFGDIPIFGLEESPSLKDSMPSPYFWVPGTSQCPAAPYRWLPRAACWSSSAASRTLESW